MPKVVQIGRSWGVVIPKPLLEELCWLPGDPLILERIGEDLKISAITKHQVGLRSQAATRFQPGRAGTGAWR